MNRWLVLGLAIAIMWPSCLSSPLLANATIPISTSNNESTVVTSPTTIEGRPSSDFDMASFCGGAVLTIGITGTAYFGIKFYNARNPDYRHI